VIAPATAAKKKHHIDDEKAFLPDALRLEHQL